MSLLEKLVNSLFTETASPKQPKVKAQSPKPIPIIDEGLNNLDKRISAAEMQLSEMKKQSRDIIIGVLLASVLIIATIAVEVILFHNNEKTEFNSFYKEYYHEMEALRQSDIAVKESLAKALLESSKKDEKIQKLNEEVNSIKGKLKMPR